MAFDPADISGNYGTVAATLEAEQHFGPIAYPLSNNQFTYLDYTTNSKHPGHMEWHIKIRPETIQNAGSQAIVGGAWFSLRDTSAIVGSIKPYIEAQGAGLVSYLRIFYLYHLQVRSRT